MTVMEREYLPAAGRHSFLPLYDPLTKLMGIERAHNRLIGQAGIQDSHSVLEIGCGTGTLSVAIKRRYPTIRMVGLDPDPKALARARRKADCSAATIQWDEGFADAMNYPDSSFDRVLSSFMFHHLPLEVKKRMFREVRRVLKPGGRLELMDFAGPDAGAHLLSRIFHSPAQLKDNSRERVLQLMAEAGLSNPTFQAQHRLLVWHVTRFQAARD